MKTIHGRTFLCLFLAFAVMASFAGCQSSQPSASGGKKPTSSKNPGETKERGSISATVYDRGAVPAAEGTIEENRWTKWINENGPVDVKFVAVPRTESGQKLNTLFASGSAPDLIFEYNPSVKTPLYDQKQLMPIDEMIDKYSTNYKNLLKEYPSLKKAAIMPDGKMYQFGKINSMTPLRGVVIRSDWLKRLNLEVPKTLEDCYKVAKAFTEQDPDGNGKKDTFGIAMSYRAGETVNQMFQVGWIVEDGKLIKEWDHTAERLKFQKRLYDEGLIDKDYLNDNTGARALQDFVNGKVGILPWLFSWRDFTIKEYATLKDNVPEAKLEAIPYPEMEYGRFNPTLENPVQMTAVVNAKCKDPKAVMQYVDFMCSEKAGLAIRYGLEGEHYKLVEGKPVITDTEKFKNEVSWAGGGFGMLMNAPVMKPYASETADFNLDNPIEEEGYELYKQAIEVYLDPSVPYPELTHSEHMPQLPKDLNVLQANIDTDDFMAKAVVSGSSYTVDQAIKDAKNAWEKGGGKEIEEWMANWYEKEGDNAFLAKDMYEIMEEEDLIHQLK